jgi:ATP-binding cassette subfamily B protein
MDYLRRLGPFLKPYWKPALAAPLLMVLEVAMDLMQPRMIQRIVDEGIANKDLSVVFNTGLLMVIFAFAGAVGGIGCTFFAVRAAVNYGVDLRSAMYRKVQTLSFGNLDRLGVGQLITRLMNDVTQVQEVVLVGLRILVRSPLLLVGSLIMGVLTSPRLALMFIVLIPTLMIMLFIIIRRAYPLYARVQDRLDRLNTVIQENLSAVRVVKAFVRGKHEEQRFGGANTDLMTSSIRAMLISAIMLPCMMILLNFGVVAVLWFGGVEVVHDNMTIGQIVAFVNYLRQTLFSLTMVSMLLMRISRAQASAERIIEVFDSEPEIQNRPDALAEFAPQGRVAFEHVTFSYEDGEPVLQDISFVAEPGQTVAILGATGSGKSSLIHLIPRFYDVDAGRVTIDGVDVRDIDQEALRANIGVALQESVLFSGTISDNIMQGRADASEDEVCTAARAAQAHDFITAMSAGYETELGQRGVNLSGGQKQRIAIARALVRRPTILILDDSTSAVDVETESHIETALEQLVAESTRFVVAQRISTVLNADKILVLDGGRLVAEGAHQDLLESSPIYREIYESQLGDGRRETVYV